MGYIAAEKFGKALLNGGVGLLADGEWSLVDCCMELAS
jgi:hypothetical protein